MRTAFSHLTPKQLSAKVNKLLSYYENPGEIAAIVCAEFRFPKRKPNLITLLFGSQLVLLGSILYFSPLWYLWPLATILIFAGGGYIREEFRKD